MPGRDLQQCRCGVHRKGLTCDLEHRRVVNGVAEYHIRGRHAGLYQRFGLALAGGNVEQLAGNYATQYLGTRGNDPGGRNVEATNAFFNDPVVGRADHPDLGPAVIQRGNQGLHFGEDFIQEARAEESGRRPADFRFAHAIVDLHHFPAHGELRDFSCQVEAVAGVDPVTCVAGDDALFDRPHHEVIAGVSAPQRSIAVEDGDGWVSGENRIDEFFGGKADRGAGLASGQSGRSLLARAYALFYSPRSDAILHFRCKGQVNVGKAVSLGSCAGRPEQVKRGGSR